MILPDDMDYKLKYVSRKRQRDGSWRYRFRRDGIKTTMPGQPGSIEFIGAYQALLEGRPINEKPNKIRRVDETKGTVNWLVEVYCQHMHAAVKLGNMSPLTLKQRENLLRRFAKEYGRRDALQMPTKAVRVIMTKWSGTPGAANNLLKSLRAMYVWAISAGHLDENPTDGIRKLPVKSRGFIAWTTADLRQYVNRHPAGTKAHLVLMILIFTACRRSDLVKLGRQHIADIDGLKVLSFTQTKGGNNESQRVTIPILPPLMKAINSPVAGDMIFVLSDRGKPFTTASFGARFKKWCIQAELGHLSAHGIRKAAGALLADAGCTQHEIMAIHGHSDARTSDIYTKTANRLTLAKSAMDKFAKINW